MKDRKGKERRIVAALGKSMLCQRARSGVDKDSLDIDVRGRRGNAVNGSVEEKYCGSAGQMQWNGHAYWGTIAGSAYYATY